MVEVVLTNLDTPGALQDSDLTEANAQESQSENCEERKTRGNAADLHLLFAKINPD